MGPPHHLPVPHSFLAFAPPVSRKQQFSFIPYSVLPVPLVETHTRRAPALVFLEIHDADALQWFARFWAWMGPRIRIGQTPRIGPLIAQARGVVLDIGPAYGEWLGCFDKAQVRKIYGIEPNPDCHEKLWQNVKKAGLEDIYVIVPVGVEGLAAWVKKEGGDLGAGDVDSVVTVFCLCSVPEPERMIGELYGYLNEGGIWIVHEHVKTKEKGFIAWYQGKSILSHEKKETTDDETAYVDLFWPHFVGGCSITRDTPRSLKEAGSWSKVDLKQPEEELPMSVLPHIMGVLTK